MWVAPSGLLTVSRVTVFTTCAATRQPKIKAMNRSEVRKLKNDAYRTYSYVYDEYDDCTREYETRWIPNSAPHAPNKKEGKMLRRIMAQTGLTEEQVRQHKCYRVQLAKASNPRNGTNRPALMAKRRLRYCAAQLALPTWHPEVIALLHHR